MGWWEMTKYGLVRLGCAVALLAAACGSESDGVSELTLRADGHEVLLSGVSPVDVGSDASSAGSAFDSPYAWQLDVVANDLAPVPVTAVSEAANATRRISEVCVDGVSGRIALQVGGASSVTLWVPFGAPDFDEAVQLS